MHGKTKGYRLLADATGYGTGEGLCGWNCRHNFYAFYEGSPRTYTKEYLDNLDKETYEHDGVEYTNYEAGQKQRAYERQIRAEKRDLAALNAAYNETTDKALKDSLRLQMEPAAVKLKRTEAEMKRFCKATKRRVDTVRTQVHAVKDVNGRIVGFDKSAAQRANKLYKNKNMGYNTRKGATEKKYPRNYVSANEAVENALQRNSDRVYKKLLHGETTAIYEYSLTDYGITNRYLRNALLPDDDVVWNQTVERIRYLDSVLGKSTLNEDLLLYRGVDIAEFNDLAKGDTLTTYKSTSIKRDVAEHFGDYQIIIKAPAKTKGFYLGKYSDVKSEKEFLLHRNQKYRVLKIHNNVMEIEIYG